MHQIPHVNQRYFSLDVFRGATVALMILVNNPGSWSNIYSPFEHAAWHGSTPTDLVFPFFLFAVGNALSFVMPRFETAGSSLFWKKVLKRTLLIFLIGSFLNWFPFVRWQGDELVFKPLSELRILGVLQRIALCYFFASVIIYYFRARGAFLTGAILLLLYWVLCLTLGNPADPFSLEGFWGTALDRNLLGEAHLYKGEGVPFDPEGLASTLPAITQVIFGYLVGQYIQLKGKNFEMITNLFIAASLLLFASICWNMVFPINKKIWTSSYVLFTTGLAINVLAVLIYFIEFRQFTGAVTRFLNVFGKNALFIYFLSGFLPRLLGLIRIAHQTVADGKTTYITPFGWFYQYICKPLFTEPKNASLLYAFCLVLLYWSVGYVLDRKKIYVKV